MPLRPSQDRPAPPVLTLVTSEPAPCPYGLLARSELPPGVHPLGPDPERRGYTRFDLVSDDGRLLQPMSFPDAMAEGKLQFFWWWRDKLSDELQAHRCPECPVRPPSARRRTVSRMA